MFPELFRIPGINFTVSTYGLMLAISFISGLWLAAQLGARDGCDKMKIYDIGLYMLIAVLVGSKLLMVITEWQSFASDPRQILTMDFWRSAGVFYGGFIGAVASSFYFAHRYQINWWTLADACAPGVAVGQCIGRLGCFGAGCCWGKPTTSWFGVEFTKRAHELTGVPIGVHLHPTQLYESIAMFFIIGLLLATHRLRVFRGQVILTYAVLYSIARFTIEIVRDDPRGELFGFSTSQFISLVIGPIALITLIYRLRRAKRENSERTDARLSEQLP